MEHGENGKHGPSAVLRSPRFWLLYAAPPLLLMAFIFWLGTDRASAPVTRSFILTLLERYLPAVYARLSEDALAFLNVAIRKTGHFGGYGLLAILNARALRASCSGHLSRRAAFLAWGLAVAWASVDEYHQGYSPSRGASPGDVALDAAGAFAGLLLYLWICRRWKPKSS